MTPEQWETIKELVEGGLERQGDGRARFVDEACAGDPSLRVEVSELIASYEQAGSFMAASPFDAAATLVAEDRDTSLEGQRIGAYRNVRALGHGGMGTVYLAVRDDEVYRKEVAVKLIKRGMDTDGILRAFRTERQILATLDHPNIARLLDGGTTDDGRPYFVMDYVEGVPLDVYCDAHTLSILDRLKLFRIVCSAVHYAHQHGVIHRDLKPGNILVTPGGVPKLLDFGIAKVLNPELPSTTGSTTMVQPLTPAYASPEQTRGEAVTPVSDVYSLGVLLYEMVTGHRPYLLQGRTPHEFGRVICEEQPRRPSTIISRLDGDLDNVVLMALRKEPGERYASVDQLSEDLRRYLEGLPILARKPTLMYRSMKLVGRNRATAFTAATSLMIILALSAVAISSRPFRGAEVARASALPVTTDERLRLAKPDTGNPAAYREYLLGRHFWSQRTPAGITAGLQHFAKAIELDPSYALAHAGIADSYIALASFRVSPASNAYLGARAAAGRALELDPALPEALSALAMVHLYYEWNWAAAERAFKRALELKPDDGTTHMRYALALPFFGRFDDALGEIARAREADPLSPVISGGVGEILFLARRYGSAVREHRKTLELDPNFWLNHHRLGLTYAVTGEYDLAIAEFYKAIDLSDNSGTKAYLAYAYAGAGRSREALTILDELQTQARQEYISPFDLAVAYTGLGDRDRAFSWLEKAYQERVRLMPSLKVDPLFDPLHSDPRFAALIERMSLFDTGQDQSLSILPSKPR
jgi:serine/threonine protein kinase/tetratricopeptide (TPR) repeat protein